MNKWLDDDLPIFALWMDFLTWLLDTTVKFPKRIRFTLSQRIENLALDIVEDLVEARYSSQKVSILRRANLRLEKIRVLLRICHTQRYLSHTSYHHAMRSLHEVGSMLGGWMKERSKHEPRKTNDPFIQ